MRIRQFAARCVLVLVLVAAGCAGASGPSTATSPSSTGEQAEPREAAQAEGSADQDPSDGNDSTDASTTEEASDATESLERADDGETRNDQFVSPVFEALGFDPNDRQAIDDAYLADVEELVRQCMAEAGFDYEPTSRTVSPAFARQLELSATISAEQFTAEYGYGIATLLEVNFREEGVLAFVDLLLGAAPEEARSPGEQAAYELALTGETIQGLSPEEAQEQAFENIGVAQPGSCRAHGFDNADNSIGEKFDGLFTLLGDEYGAIQQNVENDPRVRTARAEWQTCMAGHGYGYETADEIQEELFDASNDLANTFQTSPEALGLFAAAGDANLSGMNADDRFDWLESNGAFQGFSMVPSLQAELDELIEFELTVAGHSEDCADVDTFLEVSLEYEQAFVEAHAEQLELIAAGNA